MWPAGFLSDAMGPCMTTCPRFITTTASQTDSTSGMTCEDRIRLMCLLCAMSRMSASISSRPFGSMPLVGSSSSSRSGSCTSAWASLMRCFMPGRIGFDVAVARFAKADVVEHFVRALHRVGRRQAGQLAAIRHERDGGHAGNLRVVLRHVADARANLERGYGHVEIEHRDAAVVGFEEAEQAPSAWCSCPRRSVRADRPPLWKRGRDIGERPLGSVAHADLLEHGDWHQLTIRTGRCYERRSLSKEPRAAAAARELQPRAQHHAAPA